MALPAVGEKYERLTVLGFIKEFCAGQNRNRKKIVCLCDCGNEHTICAYEFRRGRTKSCGCKRKENTSETKTTHGMSRTKFYACWARMIDRTKENIPKRDISYQKDHITISDEWKIFENFKSDMHESYFEGASIDRIDPMRGYCKENCRWITTSEQPRNKGKSKRNKTGVTGVHYRKTKGGCEYFVCCYRENGKQVTKLFSIKKLGYDVAFAQACAAREEAINRLILLGIGYTIHHGK